MISNTQNRPFEQGLIPSLDGWRALSVFLVLFSHSMPEQDYLANLASKVGSIGVRFFFVISGFLITWLMLREQNEHGRLNLKNFYIRRCFRILPVYIVFIVTCIAFGYVSGNKLNKLDVLAAFTFTGNYITMEGPINHLWSLSVEEQFYLIWPIMCVFGNLLVRPRIALAVLVATCLFCPVFRGVQYLVEESLHPVFHHFSFFAYADQIAVGCIAAILLWYRPALWDYIQKHYLIIYASGACIFFALMSLGSFPGSMFLKVPLGPSFQTIGFTFVMLATIASPRSALGLFLNWKPVVWVGILSYSIYVWHGLWSPAFAGWIPVLGYINEIQGLWMVASFVTAIISFYTIEKKFINMRKRFAS